MIAVVSDLHAMEPERLDQLDRDIGHFNPDEIWCLGDLVGYGKHPRESVSWARDRCRVVVSGNHDAAVAGQLPGFLEKLPGWLKQTLLLARKELSSSDIEWLKNLPRREERLATRLVHGSGTDPWMGFIETENDIRKTLQDKSIALVGHTHNPGYFSLKNGQINHRVAEHTDSIDLEGNQLILNPGTAGLKQTDHGRAVKDRRPGWLLYQPDGFAAWRRFGPKV